MTQPSDYAYLIEKERDAVVSRIALAADELRAIDNNLAIFLARQHYLQEFVRKATALTEAQTALADFYRGKTKPADILVNGGDA